ncbi:MAG TPA: hypothetical protein VL137_17575 [Polyangiaceae bacterium]|nr:hypothetical protein [Polyangiaceae bacterium]
MVTSTSELGMDPDLEALPEPRRPWRRVTLVAMTLTLVGSLALAALLLPQLRYALSQSEPVDLGDLQQVQLSANLANRAVRGSGVLDVHAIAYQRPLESSEYRLVPLLGNDHLWVELPIPSQLDASRFIPPTSFVGRLVPLRQAGLGYDALAQVQQGPQLQGSWLLLDGESPEGSRWVIGVMLLLSGFAGFAGLGLYRVLRRAAPLSEPAT